MTEESGKKIEITPEMKAHAEVLLRRAREGIEVSKDLKNRVEDMLTKPDLLYNIKKLLDKSITGENENKLLSFCLGLSGTRPYPLEKQIVTFKGETGAGKSTIIRESVSKIFKTKERGRFSARALEKAQLEDYEILVLKELYGEEETRLRLLSADDRGYIAEVMVRDRETKRWTTEERHIPAVTIFTSTTAIALNPMFERRAWLISSLDTSPSQTERVWDDKAQRELAKVLGREIEDPVPILRALVNSLERDLEVVVPYVAVVKDALDKEILRSRGDWDKLLTLVKLVAYLHQKRRPRYGKKIYATPMDIWMAYRIGGLAFMGTLKGLDKRVTDAIIYVLALASKEGEFTTRDLAEITDKSKSWANEILKFLVEKGALYVDKSERQYKYTILDEKKLNMLRNPQDHTILETVHSLGLKSKEAVEKLISSILQEGLEKNILECLKQSIEEHQCKGVDPITGVETYILL